MGITISETQESLLNHAFNVIDCVPTAGREELIFKNMWNFNLPDAAFGWVLLDIKDGRVSAVTKAQGYSISL